MGSCQMIFVRLRRLTTIFISIAIILFPSAQFGLFARAQSSAKTQEDFSKRETNFTARAIVSENGVLLKWSTDFEIDILGFEVYRIDDGKRTLANRTIIPGSIFIAGSGVPLRAGYSYQWFDRHGATDSVYYIESISVAGKRNSSAAIAPVPLRTLPVSQQSDVLASAGSSSTSESTPSALLKQYPAGAEVRPQAAEGTIENQWFVASQTGLKISVKKDGWYRVTQSQMAAAGFNPVVDIKNLSLFGDGQEIGILTSKDVGQLGSGDYIEFYGQGMDTPTTDTRIYYLFAGTASGKRVSGEIRTTGTPDPPPVRPPTYTPPGIDFANRQWFAPLINLAAPGVSTSPSGDRAERPAAPSATNATNRTETIPDPPSDLPIARPSRSETVNPSSAKAVAPKGSKALEVTLSPAIKDPIARKNSGAVVRTNTVVRKSRKGRNLRKRRQSKSRKAQVRFKRHYSHAVLDATASTSSFNYTVQLKSRLFYVYTILNGDAENYFGDVIFTHSVNGTDASFITENLPVHNVQLAATGTAQLEVALQGIVPPAHQINVFLNDVLLGSVNFAGLDHGVRTFSVLPSQLQEGDNTIKMAQVLPPGTTSDTVCLDYLKLTYPHSYTADSDSDSLRFNLRSTQSLKVDGFATPNVRLLDISDPTAVKLIRPLVEPFGTHYMITVPSGVSAKAGRMMYALPEGQFLQPAGFSLNQPSTLNLSSNGADLLIIAYKDFIPSLAPLIAQRQGQGLRVVVADIEDVFDEFSFGAHSPQAIKSFVAQALGHWTLPAPRYLLLAGDASLDPRDYEGYVALNGARDFVPSKLVDTAFGEACSDDSLADLDGDGIPELAVGRLPVQTVAQANLVVSKIVNFSPANVPKTTMLVADTQGSYFFNFEQADDDVQALLPASMAVQKVYRRLQPSDAVAHTNIVNTFNQGLALVNYSGHGNANAWTGGSIFQTSDAMALTNGNNLPFVVVMDCLNGRFDFPDINSLGEAFLKAPNGGAVAVWASSGLTIPNGQHEMSTRMYQLIYGGPPIAVGDAIRQSKSFTLDTDVRRTWIFLGDPTIKVW